MVDHRALTIQSLPNEVLLFVFSFHRLLSSTNNCPPAVAWRWHILAHVCQRWRHLIFGSLHHLGARLVIPRNSLKTPSDSWPILPVSVWYESEDCMSSEQEAKAVAAFENSDRIREISLPVTMVYLFWGHLRNKKSFQELEHLVLSESRRFFSPTALPYEFLGGPSPRRLRNILLNGVHLPTLPQLLLSSRDLVSLHLGYYTLTCNGFISPEVLSTSLSATTRLEYLYIDCHPPTPGSYPPNPSPSAPHATPPCTSTSLLQRKSQLTSGNSSPLVVLSALTYFHFGFFIEYMENFVSRIHAPHLQNLDLSCKFSDQGVLNFPQLSQFISRTERLSSLPFRTSISLDSAHSGTKGFFSIDHHFKFL